MKKVLAALLFCLLSGSASLSSSTDVQVFATAIPIDPADPAHRQFGRLRYLAGWQLTSRQRNFGGYSSMSIDGDHFFLLADTGDYLRFRMAAPGRISEARFGTLPAFPGEGRRGRDRDSEAMTIGPEGDVWVAFEGHNAILRYPRALDRLTAMLEPPAMKSWAINSGPEAMARLQGGRFVVFAEGNAIAPHVHGSLMFPGDPTNPKNVPFQFGYRPPLGYVPTDAQQLPDGRLIVLNRHFGILDGFWAAVAIVDTKAIKPGVTIDAELLAEFKPPLNIDNMEGVSITREGAKTILWLVSDDNQVPLERTLLLKFQLD